MGLKSMQGQEYCHESVACIITTCIRGRIHGCDYTTRKNQVVEQCGRGYAKISRLMLKEERETNATNNDEWQHKSIEELKRMTKNELIDICKLCSRAHSGKNRTEHRSNNDRARESNQVLQSLT